VSQFTLALVLLAAAGLLVRSLVASRVINGDMPRQQILTARVALPSERYPDRAAQHRFFEEVLGRLIALPGATGAALMTQAPGLGSGSRRIEIEGAPLTNPAESPSVPTLNVSPGYFHMFDLTIGRGRSFDDRDGPPGREVAIVTPEFVRRYLANEDPIGRRFRFNSEKQPGPWTTVVGVSGDLIQGTQRTRPDPVVFVPFRQEDAGSLLMAVRTAGEASRLTAGLRSAIQQIDLDLALFDVRTLHDAVEQSRLFFRVFAGVFSIFGGMALLMAAIGLYAVMAQATARRTREIGIRMALGATPSRILATVMRRGVVQIAVGLVLGLSLALATADTMRTLLFGIVPRDPTAFTAAAAVLVGAGLLACWLPAWRAARLPPVYALTQEER
jgi:predicted permease